ncbi:unnamed protein product [Leptidea sinapis]|uniref:Uncharacterized protein n=1 Tax=Leptidea sinapis TaxID=189913 RepID=A0A5E4Q273_9NEOP|nr:unnamed protein product [Leptidea sinapis]
MVCVELVARGRGSAAQSVIFLGSIRYDALTRVYDARRRLSDPSANITSFARGGWRMREKDAQSQDKSRSENEGLDTLGDGLAEVEAGDLRDGGGAKCGGCGCGCKGWPGGRSRTESMHEVYGRPAAPCDTPACLHVVSPRRPAPRAAPNPPPLRPLRPLRSCEPSRDECEIAFDAASLDESELVAAISHTRAAERDDGERTVRGEEELPSHSARPRETRAGRRQWSGTARAYCTLPRRRGLAAAMFRAARLPPCRTTPDGTDIYY